MIAGSVGPLSRPVSVRHLPAGGLEATVEATAEERAALAADLGLPELRALTARFLLTGNPTHVRVRGRLKALAVQTCVVTLDEFASSLDEAIEVEFRSPPGVDADGQAGGEHEANLDAPDELVGELVDLGAITAEFLALSLDPYPRKPGVEFATDPGDAAGGSPFAALAPLRKS